MGARLSRGHVVTVAALAATASLGLAGASATAAPRQDVLANVPLQLRYSISNEQSVWRRLVDRRTRSARFNLGQELRYLRKVRANAVAQRLSAAVPQIDNAISHDIQALAAIARGNHAEAFRHLGLAIHYKAWASGAAEKPRLAAPQCADGRDNDGDRLVDARYDSGCTNGRDRSERSPLTCRLRYREGFARSFRPQGTCTGPFAKLEINAPAGSAFDTSRPPIVTQSAGCRYMSPRRLECLMRDGVANPTHGFGARLRFREGFASSFKLRVTDFARRSRTWTVLRPQPSRPAADLRVEARVDGAFLDRNGQGRVSGTLTVANLGPNEAGPFRLLISSNRPDSARAAEVDSLSCTRTQNGTACTGPRVARDLELAYAFGFPVSGAGTFTATFELESTTTTDPQPANDKVSVEVELRPEP